MHLLQRKKDKGSRMVMVLLESTLGFGSNYCCETVQSKCH